jgi:hypothetical protein
LDCAWTGIGKPLQIVSKFFLKAGHARLFPYTFLKFVFAFFEDGGRKVASKLFGRFRLVFV